MFHTAAQFLEYPPTARKANSTRVPFTFVSMHGLHALEVKLFLCMSMVTLAGGLFNEALLAKLAHGNT